MIVALVIGTLLAVGALAFVLYPIFFGVSRTPARVAPAQRAEEDQSTAVAALREIEFDRATGKLSEADYTDLKTRYTREAIAAMRRDDATRGAPIPGTARPTDDEVEAVVRAFREQQIRCSSCGPRPEPDAIFCSSCGRFLRESCAGCGAPVEAPDARFCVKCGHRLAA